MNETQSLLYFISKFINAFLYAEKKPKNSLTSCELYAILIPSKYRIITNNLKWHEPFVLRKLQMDYMNNLSNSCYTLIIFEFYTCSRYFLFLKVLTECKNMPLDLLLYGTIMIVVTVPLRLARLYCLCKKGEKMIFQGNFMPKYAWVHVSTKAKNVLNIRRLKRGIILKNMAHSISYLNVLCFL